MIEEITIMYPPSFRQKYRYYESGHVCKIKVKAENFNRRVLCGCSVDFWRIPRFWWRPFYWLGKKKIIRWIGRETRLFDLYYL